MQAAVIHSADISPAAADPRALAVADLRELAIRADSSSAGRDPTEAALAWGALVDGRSTIIDQFDAYGRRYIVVRRRDRFHSTLTARQREVVYFAALGYASKRISYELGISQSTVALHLKSAANKLGYRSRVCLVLALAAARARDANHCRGSPPK
jgi:DNA-binding NarL/FixJ family response regulator